MKRAKPSLLVHPRLKRLLLRLLHLSRPFLCRTVSVRHVVNIVVANHTIKLLTCNDFSQYKKRNIVGGGCVTDILSMIRQNREARGWTEYQLAERSGLPQSTISSWYKKGMTPSFSSLEKICGAFGLTLSQFFADGQERLALTDDQRRLLDAWALLTAPQKDALLLLMQTMY